MALTNKHFNSLSVKHRFPSQRSRFDSRRGKHPWILFWYSVTVLLIEHRRCRSCISVKILSSAYVEPNLGWGWIVGVWRRGCMNKPFGQKRFLINSEVQNSRKVCPGWILRQERKGFTIQISIYVSIRLERSMNDVGRWWSFFLESKLVLVKRKAWRLNE